MMEKISSETVKNPDGENVDQSSFNSVYIIQVQEVHLLKLDSSQV